MFDSDEDDGDDFDDSDSGETTVPCPRCGSSIYDDAERCPECGHYLSREDRPMHRPVWIMVGVGVCLMIVAWWTLR